MPMGCVVGKSSLNSPTHIDGPKGNSDFVKRTGKERPYSQGQNNSRTLSGKHDQKGFQQQSKMVRGSKTSTTVNAGAVEKEKSEVIGRVSNKKIARDEFGDGWPKWLVDNIPRHVLANVIRKTADSYVKIAKIGRGTYSNVYKARDKGTGKIVALKKVRFDTSDSESIKFMAREIMILQTLDHPNVIKLEGLATSRMQYSLYLVFDFMHSDLARIISRPGQTLTEPQIKCYMEQLLSGLKHCHEKGVMHRDIKASNLLIDKTGLLKIGDFGLAHSSALKPEGLLTNKVVTLWYRAPELLLGSTDYGFAIDLWSAGCLLAEMFIGRPFMPGRTEIEQIHMIFKLCGTPLEEYWKKLKPATSYRPPQHYKPNYELAFRDFPSSSLALLTTLLHLDPDCRGSAESALGSEFFKTSPLACDLSALSAINQKEDERSQTRRVRRHKDKGKGQSSHTSRASHSGKNKKAEQITADSKLSQEEKNMEGSMQGEETGSSSGISMWWGSKLSINERYMNVSLSPVDMSGGAKKSPRSYSHPSALKFVKNYLQASIIDMINSKEGNEVAHLRRSVSAVELRHLPQNSSTDLYGFGNNLGHGI